MAWLVYKTRVSGHQIINKSRKENKKKYEAHFSIKLTLKDEFEKKNQLKKEQKNNLSKLKLTYQTWIMRLG